jgi:hypothetical protein
MWLENANDSGTFIDHHLIYPLGFDEGVPIYEVADLDGDGSSDVVMHGWSSPRVFLWRNVEGDGSQWDRQFVDVNSSNMTGFALGDVNGDQRIDVIGASHHNYEDVENLYWFENPGR